MSPTPPSRYESLHGPGLSVFGWRWWEDAWVWIQQVVAYRTLQLHAMWHKCNDSCNHARHVPTPCRNNILVKISTWEHCCCQVQVYVVLSIAQLKVSWWPQLHLKPLTGWCKVWVAFITSFKHVIDKLIVHYSTLTCNIILCSHTLVSLVKQISNKGWHFVFCWRQEH